MKPAVFLDRDNTIIHNDGDLGDPAQVQLIQGAASAIASLCGLGYRIIVVTNQGGVARGKYTEDDVHRVHDHLSAVVAKAANGARIDAFYYCPYHPEGTVEQYKREHPTRKPQPGMLLQAAEEHQINLSQSWTIGDALRDIEAGKAAGTRTILLDPADTLSRSAAKSSDAQRPDYTARSLIEAVRIVAQKRHPATVEEVERRSASAAADRKWDAAAVARLQKDAQGTPINPPAPPESEKDDNAKGPPPASPQAAASSPAKPHSSRAFRPWGSRRSESDTDAVTPTQDAPSPLFETETATATAEPPPAPQPAAQPTPQPAPEPHREPSSAASQADADPASLGHSKVPVETSLRQILHELRHQRGQAHEFSYAMVFAIVLQMIVGVCLLGGLWMGAGDTDLFLRWIGAGIILQGATIAALLFPR